MVHPIDHAYMIVRRSYPHGIFAYDLAHLLDGAYQRIYGTDAPIPMHTLLADRLRCAGVRIHNSID
jgi:hypothetical protein